MSSLALLLLVLACGGQGAEPTTTPVLSPTPTPTAVAAPTVVPTMPPTQAAIGYIDTHNHLLRGPRRQCDFDETTEVALAAMESFGIQKTLIMPTPSFRTKCDPKALAEVVNKHPERFAFLAGGGTLNPMIQQAVRSGQVTPDTWSRFEEIATEIVRDGAVGFGEMTAEHFSFYDWHPYETAPPDHPLFLLLADIAARHDVPIDLHMEVIPQDVPFSEISPYSRAHRSPNNPSMLHENLTAFERLLDHNPEARIVWAHAGWDNTGFRTVALMRRLLQDHPNLYIQIRPLPPGLPLPNRPTTANGQIAPEWEDLIRSFPDRFVIGLDSFYEPVRPQLFQSSIGFLSQLPPDLARKVAYENAVRIYKLNRN
ncbi:MAG: amidohydrolase family protein [Dehalococcoidia bacterium]